MKQHLFSCANNEITQQKENLGIGNPDLLLKAVILPHRFVLSTIAY